MLYFHEVSEKIWLSPQSIQIESDSSEFSKHIKSTWTGYICPNIYILCFGLMFVRAGITSS